MTRSPLVGRAVELRRLAEAVQASPALVLLEGESGVGKTRLVTELPAHLGSRRVLVGCCHPLREPFPLGPIIEALRKAGDLPEAVLSSPLAGALRPLLPELADRLPDALEPLGSAAAERHRLYRAVVELLDRLGPAVLVVEDLHWVDPGTLDLLRFLVWQLPDRLALLVTCQPAEAPASAPQPGLVARAPSAVTTSRLRLRPLPVAEVRELAAASFGVAPEEVSAGFAAALHERTTGVPFVVEELLRLLADRRELVTMEATVARRVLGGVEVPMALRDSLLERLSWLPEPARRLVRAAAVLRVAAGERLLGQVAGVADRQVVTALSRALGSGLLVEVDEGRYGVRHALARQAVYEGLAAPERRALHDRAVSALRAAEGPPPLAQLAYHARHAGRWRDWARHAEAAADRAVEVGDHAAAAELLLDVLPAAGLDGPTRARLAVKLGQAARNGVDHDRPAAVLREVLGQDDLPEGGRGEVRMHLGFLLRNQAGQGVAATRELAGAVPELRHRPDLAARVMASLAVAGTLDGSHVDDRRRWIEQAIATAARVRDPVLATAVKVNHATMLMDLGDPSAWEVAARLPDHTADPRERQHLARASCNLAHSTLQLGHYRAAERFRQHGSRLSADTHCTYFFQMVQGTGLVLDWSMGRWEGLDERACQVLAVAADLRAAASEARLVLGLLALARGELDRAGEHLEAAAHGSLPDGWLPAMAAASGALARLHLARGAPLAAWDEAAWAIEHVRNAGIWAWAAPVAPPGVEALLRLGRRSAAHALVLEMRRGLRGRDAPAARLAVAGCRAVLAEEAGDAERAARRFAWLERAYRALPHPYQAALALEAAGRCRLAAGGDGGAQVRQALERFDALGASWDVARCRRVLRRHGVALAHRRGRRGYGAELSPREREVALLAASGRTNKEIAAALYLSPRTVEDHVARAMRKVGVRSRTALAGALDT